MNTTTKQRAPTIHQPIGISALIDKHAVAPTVVSLMDYSGERLTELNDVPIEECWKFLDKDSVTWIHIEGRRNPELIDILGKQFKLHPLMLEDILSREQRSKLDYYPGTIFIVTHALFYLNPANGLSDEQISFVLGENLLISFAENSHDLFNPIRERLRNPESRTRSQRADYLCYALIDSIVDSYFLALNTCDERLIAVEHDLIHRPATPKELHRLQVLKREIIVLRKAVWPMREVISQFRRLDVPLISETTNLFMQDVYDHTIQAIDTIESFRDVASGLQDVYLSTINLRLNEIMKVLTIVSTIFVPLTFIASLYGMNLKHIPELEWKYTYPTVLGVMATIVVVMLYFFKRRRWL